MVGTAISVVTTVPGPTVILSTLLVHRVVYNVVRLVLRTVKQSGRLINFAEKISTTPFPFVAGLGGNMKQIKRRILNIASYENPTYWKRIKGLIAFFMTRCV